ncbi:MAG: thiamine-phosphate kinase [Nitrospirota bacterium]|nr:thiamine-phosphate kinase [Nitrospirota bacterium]
MRLSKIGEFGLIRTLRNKCRCVSPDILTGIGDDAAVVRIGNRKMLVTSDMLLEGVHFDLSFTTFRQLGHKFLAVNISDIFAMAGTPQYFIISLGIPEELRAEDIGELYSGINKLAEKFGISVIGGDTCASKNGLVLSGTLIGTADRAVTRSGAKEGDGIFVTGAPGDSAMGLSLLKKQGRRVRRFSPSTARLKLMKKHLMPDPVPLKSAAGITSMIDISDGLLIDMSHICDESGVGAVIYGDRIPVSGELAAAAKAMGMDPLEFALKGGEDYTLLFTAPLNIRTNAVKIGEVTKKGRFIIDGKGCRTPFKAEGYEHFK